jgi:hypothetical protein
MDLEVFNFSEKITCFAFYLVLWTWFNLVISKGDGYNLCNGNEIGDDFHYLFNCTDKFLKQARQTCIAKYYYKHPNTYKYSQLLNHFNKIK